VLSCLSPGEKFKCSKCSAGQITQYKQYDCHYIVLTFLIQYHDKTTVNFMKGATRQEEEFLKFL